MYIYYFNLYSLEFIEEYSEGFQRSGLVVISEVLAIRDSIHQFPYQSGIN